MATHEVPDLATKPLKLYFNTELLRTSAANAAALLDLFPELKVWKIQYKAPKHKDNAWYVGRVERDDPMLMNIKITPSNLNIEFRFPHYLPAFIRDTLKWQSSSWMYANYKLLGETRSAEMIRVYLDAVLPDYRADVLKSGGKSSAEVILRRHFESLFPDTIISPNTRLDELRSAKGRPLEFDLWFPNLKLAIEIQGPQHFREVYGDNTALVDNDKFKREWCRKHGVKLAWMNWEGVVKVLFRLPDAEQRQHLKQVFTLFLGNAHSFLLWDDVGTYAFS